MRRLAGLLCVALTLASTTSDAAAQPRGGGRSAPAQRAAPAQPAAPTRPVTQPMPQLPQRAPAAPTAPRGGGFQLNRDLAPPAQAAAAQRFAAPQRAAVPHQPVAAAARAHVPQPATQQRGRPNGGQVAVRNNPPRQIPRNAGARRRINNPTFQGNSWSWNRGVAWRPAPAYWGGGFWGTLAFTAGAALYGELASSGQTYESYAAYPDSPGATLLVNYQLTQTSCGPPDLVVIWGPDDSLICAIPNNLVGPGEYDIDSSTLTLVSE